MANYPKSSLVNCRGTFKDPANALAPFDPPAPTFRVQRPDGTKVVKAYPGDPDSADVSHVFKDGTGAYRVQVQGLQSGIYLYHFESATGQIAYGDYSFEIDSSVFP